MRLLKRFLEWLDSAEAERRVNFVYVLKRDGELDSMQLFVRLDRSLFSNFVQLYLTGDELRTLGVVTSRRDGTSDPQRGGRPRMLWSVIPK